MKASVIKTESILNKAGNKEFTNVYQAGSLHIAAQKIDGDHLFKHINDTANEYIVVLSGNFSIWTESGVCEGTSGDIICIPQGLEHGNIKGNDARILILEN
ncbi:MAG: cupin domain-containing protein [Leptospirales bacterium]